VTYGRCAPLRRDKQHTGEEVMEEVMEVINRAFDKLEKQK
jgi:hypothetical protein